MVEYPFLKNAPITEALIDIRIRTEDSFNIKLLESLYPKISDQYPEKRELHKWESKVELKKDQPPTTTASSSSYGYIFTSADKKQTIQARIDGFTFNRLKPYKTWETFRGEAFRLWKVYSDLVSPVITRVAVRYINKFDIPIPFNDFSEYITSAPTVPKELPQGISGFLSRVIINEPEISAAAIITQVFEQLINPNLLPIILDIDVFKERSEGMSEEEAWQTLEKMRHFKNRIFFASITDKTKELFQ